MQKTSKTKTKVVSDITSVLKETSADISYKEVGRIELTRFEKMHVAVFSSSSIASIAVAREIATLIKNKQAANETCVLGLATGSSPIKVYDELIRLHKEEGLSFKNVVTFNLDEYFPMKKKSAQSYFYFMHEYLFNHIDIPRENINIPNGSLKLEDVYQYCLDYE